MKRILILLASATAGCGDAATGENTTAACNPLAHTGCFLPYPSSFFETDDATTMSGKRLAIPTGALPKDQVGEDLDPSQFNVLDGWSPATRLLADFGTRLDGSQLVPADGDYNLSIKPDSQVQLFDYDTGGRVPLFAELDANAESAPSQPQVLVIQPVIRLSPKTRYVVVIQNITDLAHKQVVNAPFRALVDGKLPAGSRLQALAPRYAEILTFLDKQGLSRDHLALAWDFHTASDETSYAHLLAMRDQAFKRWQADGLGVKVITSNDVMEDHMIREINATFDVPSFLVDPTNQMSALKRDADDNPVDTGLNYTAQLLIHVPKCALTAMPPLPILIYGHGDFGSRNEIDEDYNKSTMDTLCMVEVATDWIGQSADDSAAFPTNFASFKIGYIFDRLQQAQVNFLVLARLAALKLKDLKELELGDGTPIVDGSQVYYMGHAEGGTYGGTFLSLSPEVNYGVLGVGGGTWSLLIGHSADFKDEKSLADSGLFPNLADQQILWMLTQNLWDRVDPVGYAPHWVLAPFSDDTGKPMAPKHVLVMEGRYDVEAPNVATRMEMRAAALPLLAPAIETVYGIEQASGPLDAAYTQWDFHPSPIPSVTNAPADKVEATCWTGETVHESVRRQAEAIEMVRRFLKTDGSVQQTCKASCDFPAPGK